MNDKYPDPAGSVALTKYRAHGGGVELFRAYAERRAADYQRNKEAEKRINDRLSNFGKTGIPIREFEELCTERLRLQILEELDPIVGDILAFCESETEGDQQLRVLREALRIDRGHSPYDSALAEKRWEIEQRWIGAYLSMQDSLTYRSENDIAKEIANLAGVSQRTAINYWSDKKNREPWQKKWAKQIANVAKLSKMEKVASSGTSGRKSTTKTKASNSTRKKISFGKNT